MLTSEVVPHAWLVSYDKEPLPVNFKNSLGMPTSVRFRPFEKAMVDVAAEAPMTPNGMPEVINLEEAPTRPNGKSVAAMVLGALQQQNKTIGGILQKTDQTLQQAKSMVTEVLAYVHDDFSADVQKQLSSLRHDVDGQVESVRQEHEVLSSRFADHDREVYNELWEQRDKISVVEAKQEAHLDEMSAIKEEMFNLKRQLAQNDGNHIHYHADTVIIVNHLPVNLQQLKTPIELYWFNKYNSGHKYPYLKVRWVKTGPIGSRSIHFAHQQM